MEHEIKFSPVTKETFALVTNALSLSSFELVVMESQYFDTEDGSLSKSKISLRRRMENNESVFAMKLPISMENGVAVREEEEVRVNDLRCALAIFAENPKLAPALDNIAPSSLKTIAQMRFIRQKCLYKPKDDVVFEISHDTGVMQGNNGRQADILEMEIELKAGSKEDFDLVLKKLDSIDLKIEESSKLKRALEL